MAGSTDWVPSLWSDTFNDLLHEDNELDYGDRWSLNFNYNITDTLDEGQRRRGWKICCGRASANFKCSTCRRTWPSARVVVVFHYRRRGEQGTVIMRPFGQSCRSCDEAYELPGFSDDTVKRTLLRLFGKIQKNIYGEDDGDEDGSPSDNGRAWSKPHEASLCEACSLGVCSQGNEN